MTTEAADPAAPEPAEAVPAAPEDQPEPAPTPATDAPSDAKPEPESDPSAEPATLSKPVPVPVPAAEPEPVPGPVAEAELVPEPEHGPVPEPEPEPVTVPGPAAELEPATVPEPAVEAELVPEPGPLPAPELEPATVPGPVAEAELVPEPEPGPLPAPESATVPEPAAEAELVPEPEPAPAVAAPAAAEAAAPAPAAPEAVPAVDGPSAVRKPRRRGKTALIMAVAVVLGVLGGAGVGYAVQQHRAPTPLPPLAGTQPSYPAGHSTALALTAAEDDMVKTDGDLTKLLVPAPAKAQADPLEAGIDTYLDLAEYAETRENPGGAFTWYADNHFRRAAQARWQSGSDWTTIRLVQFAHAYENGAETDVQDQQGYIKGVTAVAIPGTHAGEVFPGTAAQHDNSGTYYEGYAFFQHGDISAQLEISSPNPVSAKALLALAQNQMERL